MPAAPAANNTALSSSGVWAGFGPPPEPPEPPEPGNAGETEPMSVNGPFDVVNVTVNDGPTRTPPRVVPVHTARLEEAAIGPHGGNDCAETTVATANTAANATITAPRYLLII